MWEKWDQRGAPTRRVATSAHGNGHTREVDNAAGSLLLARQRAGDRHAVRTQIGMKRTNAQDSKEDEIKGPCTHVHR